MLEWLAHQKWAIRTACEVLSDEELFEVARLVAMQPGGMAEEYLTHFLSGRGTEKTVSLQRFLAEDHRVYLRLMTEIVNAISRGRDRGKLRIEQDPHYSNRDWQYALGGITLEWNRVPGKNEVEVTLEDVYHWDSSRNRFTKCLHEAGEKLVKTGRAANFPMRGRTRLNLDEFHHVPIDVPRSGVSP